MADRDVVVVANPKAANGRARRYALRVERALRENGVRCEVRFTGGPMDAARIARTSILDGAQTILCVGGDGTVNEVVNGFLEGGRPVRSGVSLCVAQVGTGTDFSRTTRQASGPEDVVARIKSGRTRSIDAGLAEFTDLEGRPASRHFVNIAEFGSGGAVVEKVNRTTKVLGGRISFLLAILSVMPKYVNKRVRYSVDGGPEREVVANNVVVANGRYFGGGLMPAPHAELDDGLFDVVVIGDLDFRTIRRHLKDLRAGTHLGISGVTSSRGREVATRDTQGALLDLDGELVGRDPTRFVCVPKALDLLV